MSQKLFEAFEPAVSKRGQHVANKGNKKGQAAEEAMRRTFLSKGYFAVRGVPFTYSKFDITDIDLWLYGTAGLFRERISVDIKNKKTPQAIERIMWALGLRQVLGLTKCIVVSTERRPEVVQFGRRHGVMIIDGDYLKGAMKADSSTDRITEEEFTAFLLQADATELGKALNTRYLKGKKRLLTKLNADGANAQLWAVSQCFQDMMAYPGMRTAIRRVLYSLVSFLLITLDWLVSRDEFLSENARQRQLEDGLKYGSSGKSRITGFLSLLEQCKSGNDEEVQSAIDSIAAGLSSGAESLRVDVVAEYVVRNIGGDSMVTMAREFEAEAFKPDVRALADLDSPAKAMLLMLVDFCDMNRRDAMNW